MVGIVRKRALSTLPFLTLAFALGFSYAQVVQGTLDLVDGPTCRVAGWARDPQNPAPINVTIYRDGDNNSGIPVIALNANELRTDLPFPDQNHAFDFVFIGNAGLSDGKDHALYVYAVSNSGSPGPLNGNGKILHCGVLNAVVTSYGATGDGVTDDSDAIQAAIDDTAPGGTVFIPSGTYIIATGHGSAGTYGANSCAIDPNEPQAVGLNITKTNLTLLGEGRGSILQIGPSAKVAIVNLSAPYALLRKLVFDGNGASRLRRDPGTGQILNYPCGLVVAGLINGFEPTVGNCTIDDVELRNAIEDGAGMFDSPNFTVQNSYIHDNGGIAHDPAAGQADGAQAISLSGGANATASNNIIVGNTYGPAAGFGSVGVAMSYNVILNNCDGGMILGNANDASPPTVPDSDFVITHNWVELNGPQINAPPPQIVCNRPGVIILGGQHGSFINNYVWNNPYYAGLLSVQNGPGYFPSIDWQVIGNDIEYNPIGLDISQGSGQFVVQGNKIANNGDSLGAQVVIDPSVVGQVNSDWAAANQLSYTAPAPMPSAPSAASIVNGATGLTGGISPGEILVIYGSNLGPTQLISASANSDNRLERILSGTRVLFDGVPAPLLYTSSGQIAVVAPYYLYWKDNVGVQVEYNHVKSARVTVPLVASSPGIFTTDSSGKGHGAILNQDYSLNTPANPALRGSIVILYATGGGQTDPAGVDGLLANNAYPAPRLPVSVMIGDTAAKVLYAGAAPKLIAGTMQINVQVPANAPAGPSVPIQISIGNATSPTGVTVALQ